MYQSNRNRVQRQNLGDMASSSQRAYALDMFQKYHAKHPGSSLLQLLFWDFWRILSCLVLRVFFGLRTQGQANVPPAGPLLICANHQSYLDPPAIGCRITSRQLDFVARFGLFKLGLMAWVLKHLNCVPIAEEGSDAAAIREIIKRLKQQKAVVIFPEGSRSYDGSIQPFKRGIAVLLKRGKCPVVPAAIIGAHEAWPRDRTLPRLWHGRVRVSIGTPISYEELMADGPDAALARIEAEVRTLYDALRSEGAHGT